MKNLVMGLVLLSACGANTQSGTERGVPADSDVAGAVSAEAGAPSVAHAEAGAGGATGGFVSVPPAAAGSVGVAGAATVAAGGSAPMAEAGASPIGAAGAALGGGSSEGGSSGAPGVAGATSAGSSGSLDQCSVETFANVGCTDWGLQTSSYGTNYIRTCACVPGNSCAGTDVQPSPPPAIGSPVRSFRCASCGDCAAAAQAAFNFEHGK